jgi:hypothetical protein
MSRVRGLLLRNRLIASFVVLTLLGIWPALTNGQPFFYPDTRAYVRGAALAISKVLGSHFATDWAADQRRTIQPQTSIPTSELPESVAAERNSAQRVVQVGRSIAYGVLLYFGEVLGGMWFSIIIQSLIAVYLIVLLSVRSLGLGFRHISVIYAVLLTASPLPFVTSLLTPDVFAGFLILGFAVLATSWDVLRPLERAITSTVVLFAVLAHPTHIALLLGLTVMTVGYVVLADHSQWINIRWLTAIAAACVVTAVLWEVTFSLAVGRIFGSPPVRPPFVTAKLVSMLGWPAVSKVCGSNAFAVCRFRGQSSDFNSFLCSEDKRTGTFLVADVQTKRLLGDEQMRFALAVIPPNLGRFVAGASLDVLRQLTHVGLSEYGYLPTDLKWFQEQLPVHHFDRMTSTVAARSDAWVVFGSTVLYVTTIIGAITIGLLLGGVLRPPTVRSAHEIERVRRWRITTYIQLAGIMLNAIICGGFSLVIDRYQTRVAWLILLSMITGICVMEPDRRVALFWRRKTHTY